MSAPEVKGWCPGALRPMASGDGLIARIRAPLGRLEPRQAEGLAALALRHGNGRIDLSARANLQLRGIGADRHEALLDGLAALDLLDPDPAVETRRNLTLTPFWQTGDASHQIAQALDHALRQPGAAETPGKFGFAVDCGAMPVLRETSADIRVERCEAGLICRADGAMRGALVTCKTAVEAATALAHWFLASGGAPEGRGRMKRHLAAGAIMPEGFNEVSASPYHATPPAPGPSASGQLVALEFGQMQAEELAALAQIAPLRLTPWRTLLLEGVEARPDLPSLIHDARDPRLRVEVCAGSEGCAQALSPTRELARELALELAPEQQLHISGCAKGCAHPAPTELTLTATGPNRFDLIREGRASDRPDTRNLTPETLSKAIKPDAT